MLLDNVKLYRGGFISEKSGYKECLKLFSELSSPELPLVSAEYSFTGFVSIFTIAGCTGTFKPGDYAVYPETVFFTDSDIDSDTVCWSGQWIFPVLNYDKTFRGFVKKSDILSAMLAADVCSNELSRLRNDLRKCRELEEEYQAIFDNSHDGIYITDGDGYTLRINKACERIEGIDAESLIGRHMKDLVEEGVYSESVSLKVLESGKPVTILQKTRKSSHIIATGTPVFRDNKIVRVVVNSRDISELNSIRQELNEFKALSQKYQSELAQLRKEHYEYSRKDEFLYRSESMIKLLEMVKHLSGVDSTILLSGESGSGKGMVARMIHSHSERRDEPFVDIDCGAIPPSLIESELFGYEKGAFTGADKNGKTGLIELAHRGTLFLDEVGDLPMDMQVKILRVIQEREIRRVGGSKNLPVDIKIITATNKNLEEMVRRKEFREDLFYRLNVIPLSVPALRDRVEDIPPLVFSRINWFNKKYGIKKYISRDALRCLETYSWPGNVRELENIVERIMATTRTDEITVKDLPLEIRMPSYTCLESLESSIQPLKESLDNFERAILENVKSQSSSTKEVAERLGLDRSTVSRKCKKHGIQLNFTD